MFSKTFDRRVYLFCAILMGSLLVGVTFGVYALWPANMEQGYQPEQPLDYSHKVHAGTLKIDCLYCHTDAEQERRAGVPSLATCMKCHTEVQPKDSQGAIKKHVATLLEHWNAKEPIGWEKVHDLADFVYFDHGRHMSVWDEELESRVRRMECQECHGPIEKMDVVYRYNSLKMGWCLECHRQPRREDTSPGLATRGPIHCSACHR
mgnify:CR=1 FL=1